MGGRNTARLVSIMPLVPANQIDATWHYILSQAPDSDEMNSFKRYFEKQWYPKLTPTMLSCAGQRHRTTNALEAWHRRINTGRIPRKPS